MNDNIRKFEEIGTHPAANHNAIAEALTFHEGIGLERKAARLRYLRDRWATAAPRARRACRSCTSFDPAKSCAIGNVVHRGHGPGKLAGTLGRAPDHRRARSSTRSSEGLRVTPNVYTTLGEVDVFAEEMER